jgi:hypothetical protein
MGAAMLPIADPDAICRKIRNRENKLSRSRRLSRPDKIAIASAAYQIRSRGVRITVRALVPDFEKALEPSCFTKHYPRKAQRRRECSTAPNILSMAQRRGAPSVTESLVSSGTTPAELASVQRSALLASRPARRATADGYADLRRPDQALQAHEEELKSSAFLLMRASAEEEAI